jgi:hypothetical protein
MLIGVLIALFISIPVVVAARAQSHSDTSLRMTRAGEVLQGQGPPVTGPAERAQLAFPGFRPGGESTGYFPGRMMSQNFNDWPPMLHIGDSAEIAGKTFTVKDVLLVPGSDRPVAYEPATGRKRFAPEGLRTNLFDFSKNTEVFIPPNSTLVMVSIDVEPEALLPPPTQIGCQSPGERDFGSILRISYPHLGEFPVVRTSHVESFGEFNSPTLFCLTNGWLYFNTMTLNVNQDQLWFELVDEEVDQDLAIWSLTSLP